MKRRAFLHALGLAGGMAAVPPGYLRAAIHLLSSDLPAPAPMPMRIDTLVASRGLLTPEQAERFLRLALGVAIADDFEVVLMGNARLPIARGER